MITSIDTNILSAIWSGEKQATGYSILLNNLRREGALVVCGPVWAELAAGHGVGCDRATSLLSSAGVRIEFDLNSAAWEMAADAFHRYAERRRSTGAGHPRRLLVDFLVGSHAALKSDRLCTTDDGFYRTVFPGLKIVTIGLQTP